MSQKIISIDFLLSWFKKNKRDFPWRNLSHQDPQTPYKVWVSEVMLQQTRADCVIPYYLKWMDQFPNLETLATAPLEKVIKCWEGLGYYSRARNLHNGARFLIQENEGQFPKTRDELLKIPGIGPYTAGAILSFAYQKRAPAIDGNVARVISRLFAMNESIDSSRGKKQIEEKVEKLLPTTDSAIYMEALIELGALVCQKSPDCHRCPLINSCQAFRKGNPEMFPVKKKRMATEKKERTILVITHLDKILVTRRNPGEVMAGLIEFPYFEENLPPEEALLELGVCAKDIKPLSKEQHTFTKYRVTLFPYLVFLEETKALPEIAPYFWVSKEIIPSLPFSSGHKRVWLKFLNSDPILRKIEADRARK